MAIGRRRRTPQQELFVATSDIRALDNPFYRALNGLLEEHGFDEFAEEQCREFYAGNRGRPGVPPGVYFRMLMVGYLEGLGSERGIAWRCADSFSLREFLGCGLTGNPPEHSTLSKTRKRLSVEAHGAVFAFVLERLMESGLLSGKTLRVDATTLEANAAMRTIMRREDGTEYDEFLEQLAVASGIETPTRDDLAKLDRKRPGKGSNKDWEHPHDPEARITKMKDGRTRVAHKLEQAVDMETGAVVATTVHTMDGGDARGDLPAALDTIHTVRDPAGSDPGGTARLHGDTLGELPGEEAVDALVPPCLAGAWAALEGNMLLETGKFRQASTVAGSCPVEEPLHNVPVDLILFHARLLSRKGDAREALDLLGRVAEPHRAERPLHWLRLTLDRVRLACRSGNPQPELASRARDLALRLDLPGLAHEFVPFM